MAEFRMPYVPLDMGLTWDEIRELRQVRRESHDLMQAYRGALPIEIAVRRPLLAGGGTNRGCGLCIMQAVAWVAGEGHTEEPATADEFLTTLCRGINDHLHFPAWISRATPRERERAADEQRQRLAALIPDLLGTRDGHWERR